MSLRWCPGHLCLTPQGVNESEAGVALAHENFLLLITALMIAIDKQQERQSAKEATSSHASAGAVLRRPPLPSGASRFGGWRGESPYRGMLVVILRTHPSRG